MTRWLAAAATLWLAACGSSAPKVEPPAELTAFEPSARASMLWQADVGRDEEFALTRLRPYVQGGTVYSSGARGRIGARDLRSGDRLWQKRLERPLSAGVGGGDGLLLVVSRDNELLALSAEDGKLVWSASMPSEVLTIPVAAQGRVFARSLDGRVMALDAATGELQWTFRSTVPALSLRGAGEPLPAGGLLYVGLDDGRLVALDARSGSLVWERTIAVPSGRSEVERLVDIDSPPLLDGGLLYVSSYQGRVTQLSAADGTARWSRELSSNGALSSDARRLFVTDDVSVVWALDLGTGAALWKQDKLVRRKLSGGAIQDQYLVVADFEGYLHWLSRFDGRLGARLRVDESPVTAEPLAHEDLLLVQTRSGKLAALRIRRTDREDTEAALSGGP